MNIILFFVPAIIVALSLIPLIILGKPSKSKKIPRSKKKAKCLMMTHFLMFFGFIATALILMICTKSAVYAAEAAQQVKQNFVGMDGLGYGLKYLGAALSTGISGLGAGISVASGSSAAIGAYSENEKTFSKALMFVAFGEGIAIYGLVVSCLILFVA